MVAALARIEAMGARVMGVSKEARTLKTHRHPSTLKLWAVLKAGNALLTNTVEKDEGPGFVPRPCLTALFLVRPRGVEPPLRSQNQHLKLVRLPLTAWALLVSVFIPQIEGASCGLSFHYRAVCLNMLVSRVVQTGFPEFGTLLAHIWPQGTPVDALEHPINLCGFIDLEWSHPPGSNRRPADYESVAIPLRAG